MSERDEEGSTKAWIMSDADIDDFRVISISQNEGPRGKAGEAGRKGEADSDRELASKRAKDSDTEGAGRRRVAADEASCAAFQGNSNEDTQVASIVYKDLDEWVRATVASQKSSTGFTEAVRKNKNFRNPAIFKKMISYCDIDEYGTELPAPPALKEHEYFEAIAAFQEECMRKSS